jgi:5-methylcytosine-specific restriction endonuclease McrA
MQRIPQLADAVQLGKLTWRKALLVSREAMEKDPETLVKMAEDLSFRELQKVLKKRSISAPVVRRPGEANEAVEAWSPPGHVSSATGPSNHSEAGGRKGRRDLDKGSRSPGIPSREGRTDRESFYVTLKMNAEQYALWEAANPGRDQMVDHLLTALSGRPDARPRHLVVILHCPVCRQAELVTGRGDLRASPALVARAHCDGVVEREGGKRRLSVAQRRRRAALRRARYRCESEGCRNTRWLEIHHRQSVANGGGNDLDNLIVLCSSCHHRVHEREMQLGEVVAAEP